MSDDLPVIGAAMLVAELERFQEWILVDNRDLEIQDAVSPRLLTGDWKPTADRLNELLDGYKGRLGIHGPFLNLDIAPIDPGVRRLVQERLTVALEFADEVNATHMVLHSPFSFFGSAFEPFLVNSADKKLKIELAVETLEQIVVLARQINCTLVVENIFERNTEPVKEMVDAFDSPYVQHSIDVGHAFINYRLGGLSPDGWVHAVGEKLAHVHVQDTDGLYDRHWAPGFGEVNWYAFFKAVDVLTHRPRLLLELRDKDDIPVGAQYLIDQGFVQ